MSFSSIATDANGTAGEIRLAGAGISTSATDAVPLGLVIASNGHVKTGSVGDTYTLGSSTDGSNVKLNLDAANGTDSAVTLTGAGGLTVAQTNDIVTLTAPAGSDTTYTLAAGVKSATSVPLNLTPSTGSGTAVNLTEGTGITLTQTSAAEITIAGVAQGVTSVSGTANRISVTTGNTPIVDAITSAVTSISTNLATGAQIQTAINAAVANVGAFQGAYDAATNTPDLDVAPSAAIQNGWFWAVTVAGTFFSENVQIGDFIFANQDNPGATFANWTVIQSGQDIAGSGTTDGATVKGVAGFNSNDFDVSVNGWVEAKDFSGSTPGYVPDATGAGAGTFLKQDGTWAVAGTGTVTGTGTQYKVPLWSNATGTALANSLLTQDSFATKVTLDGLLEVLGDGTLTGTGGQIKLNCSFGNHGITIESAPHSDNATYTLILPATAGVTGQVLTSGGSSAGAQLTWSTPTTGTVTGVGLTMPPAFSVTNSPITSSGNLAVAVNGGSVGQFLDHTGNWSSPGGGVSSVAFSNVINPSTGDALTITPTSGNVVVSANVFGGNGLHGIVSSGSSE